MQNSKARGPTPSLCPKLSNEGWRPVDGERGVMPDLLHLVLRGKRLAELLLPRRIGLVRVAMPGLSRPIEDGCDPRRTRPVFYDGAVARLERSGLHR